MRVSRWVLVLVVVVIAGLLGGVLFFGKQSIFKRTQEQPTTHLKTKTEEYTYLKVFFPVGGRLEIFERRIKERLSQAELAKALMKEFFNLNEEMNTGIIPSRLGVRDAFISSEGLLYLDLPSDFIRGFRGDIMDEYMLLKAILETMISNLNIEDVVVLVNGKEVESLGGHFFLNRPLKRGLFLSSP